MHLNILAFFLTGLVMLTVTPRAASQRNLYFEDPYAVFHQAEELFQQQQYAAAESAFAQLQQIKRSSGQDDIFHYQVNAAYYQAVCALELYNPDAEWLLQRFVSEYPDHPRQQFAQYQLGRFYFRNKDYQKAQDWFSKVNPGDLDAVSRTDFAFQLGYCFFQSKMLDEAKPLFAQVRKADSDYFYPSNYYFGYIALADGEYEDALEAFEAAGKNPGYEKVVPYYIAQVYFGWGAYQLAIDYASPLIDDPKIPYGVELYQLIGQSWYALGQHEKALPYLQYYVDKARKLHPQDYFQLGVAQYRVGLYEEAVRNFSQLNTAPDSIAQQALYLSGDALLKLGDREAARSSFQEAARSDADPVLKREASFLFGKLSYELDYQAVATEALREFVKNYPATDHTAEAQELLAESLLRTRDYTQALRILEEIPQKSNSLRAASQKAAFYLGVEEYNEQRYEEAVRLFELSRKYPADASLDAAALFWLGESAFRENQYAESTRLLNDFLRRAAGISKLPANASIPGASYTLGYVDLEQKRYSSASEHFGRVLDDWNPSSADRTEKQVAADATLRLGDCYFMMKNYAGADREYNRIADLRLPGADYAMFQQAMVQGVQNNFSEKLRTLETLIREYSESVYHDDALFEKGSTQLALSNSRTTEQTFDQLLKEYPNGPFTSRALMKKALLAYNAGDYEPALTIYQQVARDYKGSLEGREAMAGIRDISVKTSRPELYNSLAGVSSAEQDSVTWNAAYQQYINGDCEKSLPGLTRYLTDFPSGFFAGSAHFYRGECLYAAASYKEALPDYEFVLQEKHSKFTETSLLKAARIAFFDAKDFARAADLYGQLYAGAEYKNNTYDALKGLVRSHFGLKNYTEVIQFGTTLTAYPDVSTEAIVEANYFMAKSYHLLSRYNEAYNLYGQVASAATNGYGAESRYQRAFMEYGRGEYAKSKKTCQELIQTITIDVWVIRSYLLVADILREEGEFVQARAALSSILDGFSGNEALLADARRKLQEIEAIERSQSRLDESGEQEYLDIELALPLNNSTENP